MEAPKTLQKGKVVQVIGPVVDVEFDSNAIPEILDALVIDRTDSGDVSRGGAGLKSLSISNMAVPT